MDVDRFLAELQADRHYRKQLVVHHILPPRPARTAELDPPMPGELAQALAREGIRQLYTHQVAAVDAARAGRDAIVVTGTASGKTLGYTIPIVETILADRQARALCLFPLKALAADQQRKLADLGLWRSVRVGTYDGDTPEHDRRSIRQNAHVVMTNPDMLHQAILPHHSLWADFLANLKYVIVDEVHTYRGVFGSHAALVFRRLLRLCERYGSRPTFLCSSATIGNPVELAERLTGRDDWVFIDENGAPAGQRHVVVWNPPIVNEAAGLRRSGAVEATYILADLVEQGTRTLAFTFSREEAELVLRYLRAALDSRGPGLVAKVAAYRAGYLAAERRELERQIGEGELTALVSTVALEAGIDIGALDVAVVIGYPGTLAGFWQQAGRAGRRGDESLAILVTRSSLVDQFYAQHPEMLWSRPTEEARIDPSNVYILGGHLLCAAHEQPLTDADLERFGPGAADLLPIFVDEGYLTKTSTGWMFCADCYPAGSLNLRSATDERWQLVEEGTGRVLETDEGTRIWDRYYPGAIHLHQGEQYLVKETSVERRQVVLEAVEVPYFTNPALHIDVAVLETTSERPLGPLTIGFGDVVVTRQTIGFQQIATKGREILQAFDLSCPARTMETAALWITPSAQLQEQLMAHGHDLLGSMHAVEHALAAALPLVALCDVRDVQGSSTLDHPNLGPAATFLYDTFPGGIGLAERGYEAIEALWRRTLEVVASCPCETGCPACVQASFCGSANQPLDKAGALAVLWAGARSEHRSTDDADGRR
ncbi:MAG: DEAD/DEAH box helicase [Armatimonadetes bacterium]|nr:DEAD/DEAH box helicase [Armatimonadota bacterium]